MKNLFAKILAFFIALYGIYNFWAAFHYGMLFYFVSGIVVIMGSVGLFFRISWTQYLIYLLSSVMIIQWFYLFWKQIEAGNWPYEELLETIISLFPGACIIIICIFTSFFTFRYFRPKLNQSVKRDRS
jgi:hypothetical protein